MIFRNFFKPDRAHIGLPPGTVTGEEDSLKDLANLSILKIDFNESFFNRETINNIELLEKELKNFKSEQVTWVNVDHSNPALVEKVGKLLNVHPLVLEDIVNTHQRPNCQDWDDYIYVVVKMLYYDKANRATVQEQLSFLLFENQLISFQEKPGDVFDVVRNRIATNKGRIRKMKADYLLYSLLDAIVDQYFVVLDKMSEDIEILEKKLEDNPSADNLKEIQKLKQEVILIRRFVNPIKEMVLSMLKSESNFIRADIVPFLKDLQDHAQQVIESIEMLRDLIISVLEMAHTNISNKMNDIMKVLTMISTIFIPITFIAGIYGMNFEHMPELSIPVAYPMALSVMLLIVLIMLLYFKKKKWW